MHLLLKKLCQYGNPESLWQSVELKRDKNQIPTDDDHFSFQRVAMQLAAQCRQLGNHGNEISQRRREQYGPLWLSLEHGVAEVPAELALFFGVLEILPLPLNPDFADDPELQHLLSRVLESLNERYMLLRYCGLNPDPDRSNWMEREELSINVLREMSKLKKRVKDNLVADQEPHLELTYRQVFNQLKGEQKNSRVVIILRNLPLVNGELLCLTIQQFILTMPLMMLILIMKKFYKICLLRRIQNPVTLNWGYENIMKNMTKNLHLFSVMLVKIDTS
jgi:hypothetical protein